MDSRRRSIAKAISYRIIGSLTTAAIAFAATGSIAKSVGVGGLDAVAKVFVYYMHERAWSRVDYGREASPEYEI